MADWRQVRRLGLLAPLVLVLAVPHARAADERDDYAACLARAERVPSEAFERALAWRHEGGGLPARHCAALALVSLGQHAAAAERLQRLAEDMQAAGHDNAAEVFGQAGNAWLLGGSPERAQTALSAALKLESRDPELLIDRARAFAASGGYERAAEDLDRALELAPGRADALTFRASARRRLGLLYEAGDDIARALGLEPDRAEALLERGHLRLALGDRMGARRDWLRVRVLVPGTAAAAGAGALLDRLDLAAE